MNNPKRVALYARVSTDGQTTENQRRELRAAIERNGWTIAVEYIDHGISGAKSRKDRPQFDALLRAVARKEFDVVAAWSVDRLGRSLQDLVEFLSDLQSKKIDLYLHQQALDTSTPSGKAMFGMLGVFAEFERSIIQERVKVGLARARSKGTTLGRPKAW
jgi:DNA invertase Pin-like site-specific DNA recombinase